MVFTDDDLKRLKEWLEKPKKDTVAWYDCTNQRFMALLARLEAAETIIWLTPSNMTNCKEGSILDGAIQAWRKAAGSDDRPDKNCISQEDGSCIGKNCMHDAPEPS
jgi:hypothetical protein